MNDIGVTVLVVIVVIAIVFFAIYNYLISLKNKVQRSKSNIDVFLKKRFDLIPNLESTIKGYVKHEKELLESITKLRTDYEHNKDIKTANELNEKINSLIAVAESYPELKANELFLKLQKELAEVEDDIQAVRRIYNNSVNNYNTKIQQFPMVLIAKMLGYKEEEFLKFETEKVEVKF